MLLSQEQEAGINLVSDRDEKIVSVTGPAGTGKTTILLYAAERLKAQRLSVVLCAPTGKAARRISEATGLPALTIHRLLEFPQPDETKKHKYLDRNGKEIKSSSSITSDGPRRDKSRPLDQDVILVDEASMIGPELYGNLTSAMKPNARLRLFGDIHQLPPIEEIAGKLSPFHSALYHHPHVRLTKNYRSEDNIISNAIRILAAKMPIRNDGFEIIYSDDPLQDTIDYIKALPTDWLDGTGQVITPQRRRGALTTTRLNVNMQVLFNKRSDKTMTLERFDEKDPQLLIKQFDKIIWIKNDYTFGLLNGEIGTVLDLDPESGEIALDIEDHSTPLIIPPRAEARGRFGKYMYDPRKQIDLGYAVTTHKVQGAEFNRIIYTMSGKQPFLLNRNNFYTAITRARNHVTIITDRRGISLSLHKSA